MNNILLNNNNFIGSTHNDTSKSTSNFIIGTSNILEQHISISNINNSNFTIATSNILEQHSSNYTNILRHDVNKWINEEVEHITSPIPTDIIHTYIYNSNISGEIRFKNKINVDLGDLVGFPDYKVKISVDGKLRLFYTYNPIINATWMTGWIEPMDILIGLIADSANQGISIGAADVLIAGLGVDVSGCIESISILDAGLLDANDKIVILFSEIKKLEADIVTILGEEGTTLLEETENISDWGSTISSVQPAQATQELQNLSSSVVQASGNFRISRISQMANEFAIAVNQNPITSAALGYGMAGVSVVFGIIQGVVLDNYYNGILKKYLQQNSNLSNEKKSELLDLNSNVFISSNLIDMTVNYYNLGLIQGFINSNITTQQTIPSLSTSSLYLNNGNITNVNTINASTGIYGTLATTNNTNLGLPTKSAFGGIGDKIILATGSSTTYPSSIGMNINDMWLSTNSNLRFYNNGSNSLSLTSNFITSNYDLTCYGQIKENNNFLSNIYATSNVVKLITTYDTPQLIKHFAFYCSTTNIIYPNSGNTAYYAYHLDLRNYTKTGYIQIGSGSNDAYRVFKIKCFFGSCYFQKLTSGIPDIIDYTIYMSNKANAAGNGTIAGLNILATGIPQNYYLDCIPPNNLFLMRNVSNNFNYISIVTTGQADVRVIISDMLS